MTATIAPLIPPASTRPRLARTTRAGLPVAEPLERHDTTTLYGVAAVSDGGRIADRPMIESLGWRTPTEHHCGTVLSIAVIAGLVVITADPTGTLELTGHGHVPLPVAVRRRAGIAIGDRVLLAADVAVGRLVVHPAAHLDRMAKRCQREAMGGDPR